MLANIFSWLFPQKPDESRTIRPSPPPPYAPIIDALDTLLGLRVTSDYERFANSLPKTHQKIRHTNQRSPHVVLSIPRDHFLEIRANFFVDRFSLGRLRDCGFDVSAYYFGDDKIDPYGGFLELYGFPSPLDGTKQISLVISYCAAGWSGAPRYESTYYVHQHPDDSPIIRLLHFIENAIPTCKYPLDLAKLTHNKKEYGDTADRLTGYPHRVPIAVFADDGQAHHNIARYVAQHQIAYYTVDDLHNHVIAAETPDEILIDYVTSLIENCFAQLNISECHIRAFRDQLELIRSTLNLLKENRTARTALPPQDITDRSTALTNELEKYYSVCQVHFAYRRMISTLCEHFNKKIRDWIRNSYLVARLNAVPIQLRATETETDIQKFVPLMKDVIAPLFELRTKFITALVSFPDDTTTDLSYFYKEFDQLTNSCLSWNPSI